MTQYTATFDSTERTLDDGRVLVPGEPVDLTAEQAKSAHNKRLIESGQLIKVPKKGDDS